MANAIKRIGTMLLLMVFLLSLSACGEGNINASDEKEAKSLVVLKAAAQSSPTETPEQKPVLYIYHTHSFETYADGKSIIEIGKVLADYISETYGIKVIHDTTKYGELSPAHAYEDSLKGLESALKSNPEITHFLDIHRDAGTEKRVVKIDGKDIAPVHLAVGKGTEYSGKEKPNYEQTLAFAKKLYEQLVAQSDDLVSLDERDGRYNQHLPGICALIDIGRNKNNFEEAAGVVPYLAQAIVECISDQ